MAAAACIAPAVLVLVLRLLQVRSSAHILFHGEFAGIARLFRFLDQGTFAWRGIRAFVHETTYQWFAQGTSFLQVVAWLLEPVFGRTLWAHWGAAALLEALAVLLFAATVHRLAGPGLALLGGLALALPPNAVLAWNLQPYGNHNEFLWVPLGIAFWLAGRDPMRRRGWQWVAPVALLAAGLVLYRANVFVLAAAAVAIAWPERARLARSAGFLAATVALAAGLFAFLGLTPWGTSTEGGLGSFPDPRIAASGALHGLSVAWHGELPAFAPTRGLAYLHRLVLLGAVVGAGLAALGRRGSEPRSRVALFAAGWGVLALAAPALSDHAIGRYFVPGWCAAMLALVSLLAAVRPVRRAVVGVLVVGVLAGGVAAARWIDAATWDRTEQLDGIALWFELEVNTVDLDELPFYERIITEGRGSPYVGWSSHFPSGLCPAHPGAAGGDRPYPTTDTCSGWDRGGLVAGLMSVAGRFGHDADGREAALRDVGRGAWIRANRSVQAVEVAIDGAPGELRRPVLVGARDEAARWAGLGGR